MLHCTLVKKKDTYYILSSVIKKIENFKRRIGVTEKATKQEGIAGVVM